VHIATTRKKNNGKHCAQMLQILQRISKRSAGTCPGKVPNGVSGSPLPHKSWASSTRVRSRQDAALAWTQPTAPRREREHFTPKKRPFVRYARKAGIGKHVTLNNVGRPQMEMHTQKAPTAAAGSQAGSLGLGRCGFGA
jgi:hypothetical protein